jgi:beta-glucosidase
MKKSPRVRESLISRLRGAVALTAIGLMTASLLLAQGPKPITPEMEAKADAMLRKLTLEEKIVLLGGAEGMAIRKEPGIGMRALRMSDGPMGVKSWGYSTAYAAGVGLAASWDTDLARKVGEGIGADARARGVSFMLGPGVNIYRTPMNGRNFEYFGEDPFLAGQIAADYIRGVQSRGVIATVKHFIANNSEYDRHRINTIIDERTLREIYLPAFEAAVKLGNAGSVMDSYNRINGEYATENSFLNNEVLKKEWGFKGILMSDWGATYDGVAAANGGLDLEMGNADFMTVKTLLPAIKEGKVSESVIDDKVRRILRTAMQFGFFDREQSDPSIPLLNQESKAVALQSAEEGTVLLKNEGNLLPLNARKIHSLAVLGPNAYPAVPGGEGSSQVTSFAPVSLLEGLSTALYPQGGVQVYWNSGVKSASSIFEQTHWCADANCKAAGLNRTEYIDSTGVKTASGTDDQVNSLDHPGGDDWNPGYRRVEWEGYFRPKATGTYRVVSATVGEDSYQLLVEDK